MESFKTSTNRLLCHVVGGIQAGSCDELQITFTMLVETVGEIPCLTRRWSIDDRLAEHFIACIFRKVFDFIRPCSPNGPCMATPRWTPRNVVWASLIMCWLPGHTLQERFTAARKIVKSDRHGLWGCCRVGQAGKTTVR
jgi:hypothetical protein